MNLWLRKRGAEIRTRLAPQNLQKGWSLPCAELQAAGQQAQDTREDTQQSTYSKGEREREREGGRERERERD